MLTKITATTGAEAVSEAKKKSIGYPDQLYLFYCIKSQEYSISDIQTPYAPIFSGGYVPSLIASFLNGHAV